MNKLTIPTEVTIPYIITVNPKFLAAAEFANYYHNEVGQVRKGDNAPYIVHPMDVAHITYINAKNIGMPEEWIEVAVIGALLHDTIEDTKCTYNEIEAAFGFTVRDTVFWLTDVVGKEHGNRRVRKELEANRINMAPGRVKFIKCADILSNAASIIRDKPNSAELFITEKRALLDKFEQYNRLYKGVDNSGKLHKHMLLYTRTELAKIADSISRP